MFKPVIFRTAVFLGFTAVILGAFAAHGLHDKLSPLYLDVWKTGVQYQFYHALALLFLSLAGLAAPGKWISRAFIFFTTGIILFSGSLYLLAIASMMQLHLGYLGVLTPLGGLFFLAGWVQLFIAPIRSYARD